MTTTRFRIGAALAAPLLTLLLQSCGGGVDLEDDITEVTMEPETVAAPTAQTPTPFTLTVHVKNHSGLYLRLILDALRPGTENEYDRIGVSEAYDDKTATFECYSMLPQGHPELREVGCFGTDRVVRRPGQMKLRLSLYNHAFFDVSDVQDRAPVTAELQ